MTCIAWDGKSIAADKLLISGEIASVGTKIKRLGSGVVVGWTGTHECGLALIRWLEGIDKNWPTFQADKDRWTRLIVIERGKVSVFEQEPIPQPVEGEFDAWGSGREFSLGAMAMGATAKQAVEVANRFSITCGLGVDVIDLP